MDTELENSELEDEFDPETMPADSILDFFNKILETDKLSEFSDEELHMGISYLSQRIKSESDDTERETLFCVLVKISQILNAEYLLDDLF